MRFGVAFPTGMEGLYYRPPFVSPGCFGLVVLPLRDPIADLIARMEELAKHVTARAR